MAFSSCAADVAVRIFRFDACNRSILLGVCIRQSHKCPIHTRHIVVEKRKCFACVHETYIFISLSLSIFLKEKQEKRRRCVRWQRNRLHLLHRCNSKFDRIHFKNHAKCVIRNERKFDSACRANYGTSSFN